MLDELQNKSLVALRCIVNDLMSLKKGQRINTIDHYQRSLGLARGTIQNAFEFLIKNHIIEIQRKGAKGSYLVSIDYMLVLNLLDKNYFVCSMPLPYSKQYEGLASALVSEFMRNNIDFTISFVRGSQKRIQLIKKGLIDFAIVSEFAALTYLKDHDDMKVVKNFGIGSFIKHSHGIVALEKDNLKIKDGMRIGIDDSSLDHIVASQPLIEQFKLEIINISTANMINSIRNNVIDFGIWNLDEIIDHGYDHFYFQEIINQNTLSLSSAVIMINKDNHLLEYIISKLIQSDNIIKIQQSIYDGKLVPNY
ncbi:MAG: GntR family transcriptional regulator YhfZ [Bacilli bacterium]